MPNKQIRKEETNCTYWEPTENVVALQYARSSDRKQAITSNKAILTHRKARRQSFMFTVGLCEVKQLSPNETEVTAGTQRNASKTVNKYMLHGPCVRSAKEMPHKASSASSEVSPPMRTRVPGISDLPSGVRCATT